MMTIEAALACGSQTLSHAGLPDGRREAEYLIATLLQVSRTRLWLDRKKSIPARAVAKFNKWLRARESRQPLAYVAKEQPFRDMMLKVTPAVLVPRPETELLVEQTFRLLDQSSEAQTVIDVGTGSGCIALSLRSHPKVKQVIAIDLSREALRIARQNEKQVSEGQAVSWRAGNLLEPVKKRDLPIGLIVANLPYVTSSEMKRLDPELHWEPEMALEGGNDGLKFIEPCIRQAARLLHAGGTLLLEIGSRQSRAVVQIFKKDPRWSNIRVFQDLSGLPRIVQATRKG
jgi:release factor glutamine methyltransferase